MKKFQGILLACDMDGTLLDDERCISPTNLRALRYFADEGGLFSLATGRAFDAVTDYLDLLPVNAPYSLLNGSLILDAQHQLLHCAGMPSQSCALVNDVLERFPQVGFEVFLAKRILVCRMSPETEYHMRVLHLDYDCVPPSALPDPSSWCQINFTGATDVIAALRTYLIPFGDVFSAVATMPTFCEVTRCGVGKGAALRKIAASCNVPRERVFSAGDSDNDLSMLDWAAIGFVPANAAPDILCRADVRIRDNNHDAIAHVIEYLEHHSNT